MKKGVLIVAMAILALPGLAMAQPIANVTQNAASTIPVDGAGVLQFDPGIHTSIIIDVVADWQTNQHYAATYYVASDLNSGGLGTGDTDWTYDLTNFIIQGNSYLDPGERMGSGIAAGLDLGQAWAAGRQQYATFMSIYGPGPVILASHEIVFAGPGTLNDLYTIDASSQIGGLACGLAGPASGGASLLYAGGTPLQVEIVPEPATALLLLGAIPFLRRRR